jgi:hypothetical protein
LFLLWLLLLPCGSIAVPVVVVAAVAGSSGNHARIVSAIRPHWRPFVVVNDAISSEIIPSVVRCV